MSPQTNNQITEMRAAVVKALADPSQVTAANEAIAGCHIRMIEINDGVEAYDKFEKALLVYWRTDMLQSTNEVRHIVSAVGEMIREVEALGAAVTECRAALARLNG